MARVFPAEITAADVTNYRAALGAMSPRTEDGWETALFELDGFFPSVVVKLANRAYDESARRAVETAVTMLPHFQAWVIGQLEPEGPNDGTDDHALAGPLEIDGDAVSVRYFALCYNSDWRVSFERGCAGLWYTEEGTVLLPGPTSPYRDIDPRWLDGAGRTIARVIRDSRGFEQMPVLADALEEAGCTHADVLAHCRAPGEHGHRCCVLDLLLGTA